MARTAFLERRHRV